MKLPDKIEMDKMIPGSYQCTFEYIMPIIATKIDEIIDYLNSQTLETRLKEFDKNVDESFDKL